LEAVFSVKNIIGALRIFEDEDAPGAMVGARGPPAREDTNL
jgi:hypothetical protein